VHTVCYEISYVNIVMYVNVNTACYEISCNEFAHMYLIVDRLRARLVDQHVSSQLFAPSKTNLQIHFSTPGNDIPLPQLFDVIDRHLVVGVSSQLVSI